MKRVLIADDEPIERMIVTRTIQKYFPEELAVVSAVNGREAVEQFFAENCQIALLDIEMPGMNGLEAAEQIRERDKNCSIIFLTAFDEFNYAKRAIAVRAMEYLLKPVEDQELEAVLAEAIRIADEHTDDREAGEKKEAEHMLEDTENSHMSVENCLSTDAYNTVISEDGSFSFGYPKYLFNHSEVSLAGGLKDNAIPRECEAEIVIPEEKKAELAVYTEENEGNALENAKQLYDRFSSQVNKIYFKMQPTRTGPKARSSRFRASRSCFSIMSPT